MLCYGYASSKRQKRARLLLALEPDRAIIPGRMGILVMIAACLVLLTIIAGLARTVWNAKPPGGGGMLLWVVATLAAAVFAFVSFTATASFAESSTAGMQAVLLVILVLIAIVSRAAWGAAAAS
jgi:small-conductance mechanosensitive channel